MRNSLLIISTILVLLACNNSSKDSVEKADSVNQAIQDSALNKNKNVVEEAGSAFLVRVADAGMAEIKLTSIAMQKATSQPVKDFATKLHEDHTVLTRQLNVLAKQKIVVLPETVSEEKQKDLTILEKPQGKDFDKTFINMMISKHQSSIEMFEKAIQEVSDYDIKIFAEKTLPILKSHLEMAKSLQKKYQ